MYLAFAFLSLFLTSIAVPIAGDDPLLTLPKRASLQQVLAFLKELNRMMKDNQPSYRLHKRSAQDCCAGGEEDTGLVDKEDRLVNLMAKRLRNKLSNNSQARGRKYFPALSNFRPAYYNSGGIMDKVGK